MQGAEMQNQNVLALTSKDSHSMGKEELKSRSHLEEHARQSAGKKAELLEQRDSKGQLIKKLVEGICRDEVHLCEELRINFELQKDCERLKRLLNRAMKKLRVYEERESESQHNLQGEMKNRYSEMVNEDGRLRTELKRRRRYQSENAGVAKSQFQKTRSDYTGMKHLPSTY
ncbi:hypothetical protein QYF61_006193 [Mycteria americana]|uniref:Uncharacterized protein n=1 Tax=Mycteria americana TaxID=33587 RepID=A0AAN7PCD1_MYCAM|nr:hypothetical protein QYF61_006193 [Mycteria americana]